MRHSEVELIFSGAVITSITVYKATPSDTLLSGPEVFLIACGWAAFLIMSLSISPHYFANEYHYHTILYHMDHYAHV